MTPKVTFIVSCYDRPTHLMCLLASLITQTRTSWEIVICDNSKDGRNHSIYNAFRELPGVFYVHTGQYGCRCCYQSANCAAEMWAKGEYLCFPSDDDYYGPRFLELMLKYGDGADFIYSDYVDDSCGNECAVMHSIPALGHIDKGGFLVKRELFLAHKFAGPFGKDRPADGWLVEELAAAGARMVKAPGVTWVHN